MKDEEIEFWEYQYLQHINYLLAIDVKKLINGLNTKEKIRNDWEKFLHEQNKSELAIGSERIFYWLFNQFGIPNSSPIGSDLFFELYNAFIHIDIKTVTRSNVTSDFNKRIQIGKNQSSYYGNIKYENGDIKEKYYPHLPINYHVNGKEKICLTYFIVILNQEEEKDIQAIILTSMPNGQLKKHYEDKITLPNNNTYGPLAPGKKDTEARYRYIETREFKLLDNKPSRIKILYWNEKINDDKKLYKQLSELRRIYDAQNEKGE